MGVQNGRMRGNAAEEFIYVRGRGRTVINYVVVDEVSREDVEEMRVGMQVDSDHMPVKMVLRRAGGKEEGWEVDGARIRWEEIKRTVKGAIGKIGEW
ncbi:hypothetical protein KM043_013977 [Ampulex compressa]|nr:hypothetical protein KM043_013977 [Ampulex compressa]